MSDGTPAPVRHSLRVPLDPARAFHLFVHDLARWWPLRSHSCGGDDAVDVVFEPRVGGAVVEHTRTGARHAWGTLTAWDPPHHLAMQWHPGQPAARATRLDVRFHADGDGCRIDLVHDGWAARGPDAPQVRGEYQQGWGAVLARFLHLCKETAS